MEDKAYLEIIEINNSLKAFDEFLKEEHTNEECKEFCLKIFEKNPEFEKRVNFNKKDQIKLLVFFSRANLSSMERVQQQKNVHVLGTHR